MSLYIILSIVATVLSILAIMKEILIPIIFRPNLSVTVGTKEEYRADLEVNTAQALQEWLYAIDKYISGLPFYNLNTIPNNTTNSTTNSIMIPTPDIQSYMQTGKLKEDSASLKQLKQFDVSYNYFRLKIENKASLRTSRVDEIYVRLLNIYKNKKELTPFNTMMMRWVSGYFYEKLARGEHLFVNLVTVYHEKTKKKNKKYYALPGHIGGLDMALAAGFKKEDLSKAGDFCYIIGIYGKNFNGKMYRIKFHFKQSSKEPISNLICEPITDKDDISKCL